jgi:hypothetical protein
VVKRKVGIDRYHFDTSVFAEKGCEDVERSLELLAKVVDEVRDFFHVNEVVIG